MFLMGRRLIVQQSLIARTLYFVAKDCSSISPTTFAVLPVRILHSSRFPDSMKRLTCSGSLQSHRVTSRQRILPFATSSLNRVFACSFPGPGIALSP